MRSLHTSRAFRYSGASPRTTSSNPTERDLIHVGRGDRTEGRVRLPLKPLAPVLKAGFGRIPAGGERYFAKHA